MGVILINDKFIIPSRSRDMFGYSSREVSPVLDWSSPPNPEIYREKDYVCPIEATFATKPSFPWTRSIEKRLPMLGYSAPIYCIVERKSVSKDWWSASMLRLENGGIMRQDSVLSGITRYKGRVIEERDIYEIFLPACLYMHQTTTYLL